MSEIINVNLHTTKQTLINDLTQVSSNINVKEVILYIDTIPSFINTTIGIAIFNSQIKNYPKKIYWYSKHAVILSFLRRANVQIKTLNKSEELSDKITNTSIILFNNLNKETAKNTIKTNNIVAVLQTKTDEYSKKFQNYTNTFFEKNKKAEIFNSNFINLEDDMTKLIDKLENTKSSLKEKNKINYGKPKFSINQVRFGIFNFLLIILILFLSLNIFFPTKVYTLEIESSNIKEAELTLELNNNYFDNLQFEETFESQNLTSGNQVNKNLTSTGKVNLLNIGDKEIQITNGGIKLAFENKIYKQIFDPKLASIIRLNSTSPVSINIESESQGDGYNLANGTEFNITNLSGDKICSNSNCRGIAMTNISNFVDNQTLQVTQNDIDENLGQNNSKIYKTIKDKIQKLITENQDKSLFNENWFEIISTENKSNHEINQEAPELSTSSKYTYKINSIQKNTLVKLLKEKVKGLSKIESINITDNYNSNENSKIKVKYSGIKYDEVNQEEIKSIFSSNDTALSTQIIKQKYPKLNNIQIQEKGVALPFIAPKLRVDIIEK